MAEVELSTGVIKSHIERGCSPPRDRAVFKVLATKRVDADGCRHRLVL